MSDPREHESPTPEAIERAQGPRMTEEQEADAETKNPYGEESLAEIIRELMDSNKRLYAKSVLTEKESAVFAHLAAFAEWHKTPSLLRWTNRQLEYRMSIGGRRVEQMIAPFKRA